MDRVRGARVLLSSSLLKYYFCKCPKCPLKVKINYTAQAKQVDESKWHYIQTRITTLLLQGLVLLVLTLD